MKFLCEAVLPQAAPDCEFTREKIRHHAKPLHPCLDCGYEPTSKQPSITWCAMQGSSDDTAEKQALLNDVKESILDMAEIVLCYRNKHLVSKVSLSTLCEQRRAEADAATMCAVRRLKVSSGFESSMRAKN